MAVWGLDVEQVRSLSKQLNTQSQQVQQILTTLTTALQSVQWTGPDAVVEDGRPWVAPVPVTYCRYCQRKLAPTVRGPRRKACSRADCQRAANRARQRRHRAKAQP